MRIIKKIAVQLGLLCLTAFAAPKIWDGTADVSWYDQNAQTFTLTTAEQLAGLAELVNYGTDDFAGKTFFLGADIFLNDTTDFVVGMREDSSHRRWFPIGTRNHPFKGDFDGKAKTFNHKIYGLYLNNSSSSYYTGFFGYIDNVKISNLDIISGRIFAGNNVGALVGYAEQGRISNVHIEVDVVGNKVVGGVVGSTSGDIEDVSFRGNVTGIGCVGGIVGGSAKILRSYAEGNVKGDSIYVGGVVGIAHESIDSVYHVGGEVSGKAYVGGLVGEAEDSVMHSYTKGNVTGDSIYVGGVIGFAGGIIKSVYHEGGSVRGLAVIGGLAGYAEKTIMNARSENDVFGTGNVYNYSNGRTIYGGYVGGLVGYAADSVINSYSIGNVNGKGSSIGGLVGFGRVITKSFAEGNVKGDSIYVGGVAGNVAGIIDSANHKGGNVSGLAYVGGLVGYATNSVTNSFSKGDVVGSGDYVGGLVGLAIRFVSAKKPSQEDSTYITKSYSVGNVKGRRYVGGLIGADSLYRLLPSLQQHDMKIIARMISENSAMGHVEGESYVGGLIGAQVAGSDSSNKRISYMTFHTMACSHRDGNIVADSDYVGGFMGSTKGYIYHSHHVGGDVFGNKYVGGLVGQGANIVESHAIGNVTGFSMVGGLAGQASKRIGGSYSEGNVIGTGSANYSGIATGGFVGGLVGHAQDSVIRSRSKGDVVGQGYFVGGLVGFGTSVLSSYAEGSVKGWTVQEFNKRVA